MLWRLPAFFACLSLFHFLEFWTTAHFNTPGARADSFLLYSNGTAYNIAHSLATLEIILSSFTPAYQAFCVSHYSIAAGVSLVVVGQVARSVAMAQAGTNFNHTPQRVRKQGHELVTNGIYSWLRHPSYFGFFWWALGTQMLVGNKVCLLGYLLALWTFFSRRITGKSRSPSFDLLADTLTEHAAEERSLIQFFGKDYENYKDHARTGIPFIR